MNHHDDFAFEPVRGLPERLPPGETIVWQGAPDWKAMARRAFHIRKIAVYFGVLAAWRFTANLYDGEGMAAAIGAAALMMVLGAVAIGLFTLFAWLTARTTVYTITNKRLVLRFGIALPMTINLPFRSVKSASLKLRADGTGDIPLALVDGQRIAYFILWPHSRPWYFGKPQPSLRSVPDAEAVARQLAEGLANTISERSPAPATKTSSRLSAAIPGKHASTAETAGQPANAAA